MQSSIGIASMFANTLPSCLALLETHEYTQSSFLSYQWCFLLPSRQQLVPDYEKEALEDSF